MVQERDIELRRAALQHVRDLQLRFDDLVPVDVLRKGFQFRGRRVSFGSFFNGIFRSKEMVGLAALALVTTAPKIGRPAPYEDEFDEAAGRFTFRFRDPQGSSAAAARQAEADNRALIAAHELSVPVIYFRGIAPGQYAIVAPAFVMSIERSRRLVELEAGLPLADMTDAGLVSDPDVRRYATREAVHSPALRSVRRSSPRAKQRARQAARPARFDDPGRCRAPCPQAFRDRHRVAAAMPRARERACLLGGTRICLESRGLGVVRVQDSLAGVPLEPQPGELLFELVDAVAGEESCELGVELDQNRRPAGASPDPAPPAVGNPHEYPPQRIGVLAGVRRHFQCIGELPDIQPAPDLTHRFPCCAESLGVADRGRQFADCV